MNAVLDEQPDFTTWSEDELRLAARVMEVPDWDYLTRQEIASRLELLTRD